MIIFNLESNEIKVKINERLLTEHINNIIKQIRSYDIDDKISLAQNTITFHAILKEILLSEFIKQLDDKIETNAPYMFKVNLNNETFYYLITKIEDNKLPSGYSIDRLTMVEYLYNTKFINNL